MNSVVTHQNFHPFLIGSGRLARHFSHYLELLNLKCDRWEDAREILQFSNGRSPPQEWLRRTGASTHFWILVSDRAIEPIANAIRQLHPNAKILHSSAALSIAGTTTIHPLMTFGPEIGDLDFYRGIPLITFEDEEAPPLDSFPNPKAHLPREKRIHYHAACVMFSNFPMLLWDAAEKTAASPHLMRGLFDPILKTTLANYLKNGRSALTGPLARKDQTTIDAHLNALKNTPECRLYDAFVHYFKETQC